MRKRILILGIVLVGIMITSCSKEVQMTEEQEDMVAEYIATKLLRYNKDNPDMLVTYQKSVDEKEQHNEDEDSQDSSKDESKQESQPTTSPQSTPIPTTAVTGQLENQTSNTTNLQQKDESKQQNSGDLAKSIDEVIGIKNLTLEYQSYETTDTYSEVKSDGVNFEAEKNRTFFVVTYKLKNNSNHTIDMDLLSKKIQYVLNLNEKQYGAVISLIDNDMQFLQTTLKGGKEKKGVLVFDIPKNQKMEHASLVINNSKKVYKQEIKLKK